MVAAGFDSASSRQRFVIRSNCSLSWRGALRFYLGMVAVSFGIAFFFALRGAWLVLPFAGLEMALLGAALYIVGRRCRRRQEVWLDGDRLEVVSPETGERQYFQRAWARVELEPARHRGHPARLLVGSHRRRVEVGAGLTEHERERLAVALRAALAAPWQAPDTHNDDNRDLEGETLACG